MTVQTVETEREAPVETTGMVHLSFEDSPFVALCGAKIKGIVQPVGSTIDCHVCVELDGECR